MSKRTNILVTGANRGIGKALITTYLSRPNHTCIACVRDPKSSTSLSLQDLPRGANSSLIILNLDSSVEADAQATISTLKTTYSITHLDVVVANAGICTYTGKILDISPSEMLSHFTTNTMGSLLLFQACYSLMKAKPERNQMNPKFIFISSAMASLEAQPRLRMDATPYAISKAGCNLLARKIHFEHEELISFAVHPGWLKTDMGEWAVGHTNVKMSEPPTSLEEGISGIVKLVDDATKEVTSGGFWSYEGMKIAW